MIWEEIPEGHEVVLSSPAPFLIHGNAIRVRHPKGHWIAGRITSGCPFMTTELTDKNIREELIRWHQAERWEDISAEYRVKRKLVLLLLSVK